MQLQVDIRGATTGEKLRGTTVWVPPNTGALAPGQKPGWVLAVGCGRGPLRGSGGIIPGKLLKTQMPNPAFW